MVTAEEVAQVALFAALDGAQRERLSRVAADIDLAPGEYAADQGSERALFAVLAGKIEPVQHVDGIARAVGVRQPGEIFGEVPIALGTVFPVGFRAAEPSRVMRIDPHDYHAIAATAPQLAQEVGRLAAHRMSGLRGLQGLAAEPPPPRAIVVGQRWDAGLHGPPALPRPQPGHVPLDHAGRSEFGRPLGRPAPTGGRPSDDPRDRRQDGGPSPAASCGGAPRSWGQRRRRRSTTR